MNPPIAGRGSAGPGPRPAPTRAYPPLTILAVSVAVIGVLFVARGVLIPFALAMLVSFLLAPLVLRFQRWHCSPVVAVSAAVLLVFVVASGTGWLVVDQVREVAANLSESRENLRDRVASLRGALSGPIRSALRAAEELGIDRTTPDEVDVRSAAALPAIQDVRVVEPAPGSLALLRDAAGPALEVLLTASVALVLAFVMLLKRDDLGDRLMRLLGPGKVLVTTRALEDAAKKVSQYLWKLLLLNGIHGLAVGIGLACIGVPQALLWGCLAATLRFIPYLGPWIAAAFPVLAALAGSPGWSEPVLVIGLFATLELISNNLIEPWVFGRGTGLSSLTILVSALFWGWLWGPVGLVLSTPLTVCLVVLGKHVPHLEFLQVLLGDAPGLSPPARLYQRLIAADQDQAWLVLCPELEKKELHEVYDSIVLPALALAEVDRQRGALDQPAELRIEETIELLLLEARDLSVGAPAQSGPGADRPRAARVRVLCVSSRSGTDALAATMLAHVLERDGAEVEVVTLAGLPEDVPSDREGHVDLVCLSVVLPSAFVHVRRVCKRIADRFPGRPLLAGLWTLDLGEAAEPDDRIPLLAGVRFVASLGEARSELRRLRATLHAPLAAGLVPAAVSPH